MNEFDPIENIPTPETLNQLLAATIRRCDLLRSLIRVSRRKAAYDRPSQGDFSVTELSTPVTQMGCAHAG